ncbi:hypothetical protein, partial [Leuconostoc lactis]|uniref:hypothetical protein n=2 Tax=Leuconostoc lactis TaxID=1246 RepID=UPI002FE2A461
MKINKLVVVLAVTAMTLMGGKILADYAGWTGSALMNQIKGIIDQLDSKLTVQPQAISNLAHQNNEFQNQLTSAQNDVSNYKTQVAQLQGDLQRANDDKQKEIQQKIDEINQKIAEGNQRVADKQKELDGIQSQLNDANQKANQTRHNYKLHKTICVMQIPREISYRVNLITQPKMCS